MISYQNIDEAYNNPDNNNSPAGLIPSPELQEWRIATNAIEKARDGSGKRNNC